MPVGRERDGPESPIREVAFQGLGHPILLRLDVDVPESHVYIIVIGRAAVTFLLLAAPAAGGDDDPADEYTFGRRVTLDLVGRLPTSDEARALARSKDRDRKVEDLLGSAEAAGYHADLWMQWLLDYDFENRDLYRIKVGELHAWLKQGFERPMAQMIRALIVREGPGANFARKHLEGSEPPVKLALLSARIFLGRDIRCAQCHDHPSSALTQEEFWGYVAFFGQSRGGIRDHVGELRAQPRTLSGRMPQDGEAPLEFLARSLEWRPAMAERYWKLLMGRKGHPREIEDFETPRDLLRVIVRTKEYRSRRGPLKLMNSVQFMHAFAYVFDLEKVHREMFEKAVKNEKTLEIFKDEEVMRLFFHKWSRDMLLPKGQNPEEVEPHGTVRLSLKLMNNDKIQKYFSSGWGLLHRVLARKTRPADRVEELFLSLVGRPPTREERDLFAVKDDASYEDIFWSLVNSGEFIFVS
jgi:hypothetical protein